MAKRSTSLDEIQICPSGIVLGALVATVMTGVIAGGASDGQTNRGMLR
ncbi:hypothetical protein [Roseibium sediminicola]|uniref:Uncharacterized protein n=1 Tax=Roseibium sediminicola TaxID=2933272 RepID=A0ABT0GW90_9HYPH|nr:hypothetical protein [Roseibium sp. CAU 1639]MCK7613718.1 hypothetical protein [Roseibium sp. CAU 1639]